tara:strand:+ start:113 stop:322 length:210 start_codon:yes stop_codon:yes gene_type:complete
MKTKVVAQPWYDIAVQDKFSIQVDELTFHILDELGKPIVNDDLTPMKFRSLRELDFITDYIELDDLEVI